jgi:hypothetical protein
MKEDRKSLAGAYTHMMTLDAWKDLEKWAMEEEQYSMKRQDDKPAKDLVFAEVCEERGYRKGIKKILDHAAQRKEGI